MTSIPLGLVVETAVALLLCLTIGYSFVLNQRLKKMHADRDVMRGMINDLIQATTMANGAISQLREAATEADLTLNARLEEAERFGLELANHVTAGQTVLERIEKITSAARQSETIARVETNRASLALNQLDIHQKRRSTAA
ncbi:MAG: chemotaxis protein [Hyphomicrobiaceae bacterium]|nr:chemotaxis protein [Hyphomicrobiaceae bacterium]